MELVFLENQSKCFLLDTVCLFVYCTPCLCSWFVFYLCIPVSLWHPFRWVSDFFHWFFQQSWWSLLHLWDLTSFVVGLAKEFYLWNRRTFLWVLPLVEFLCLDIKTINTSGNNHFLSLLNMPSTVHNESSLLVSVKAIILPGISLNKAVI